MLLRSLLIIGFVPMVFVMCTQMTEKSAAATPAISNPKAIYIKVHFSSKGKVYFDYLDSNYRNAVAAFVNPFDQDSVMIKTILTNKPTVFKYNAPNNQDLISTPFIGLNNGDTLSFSYKDNVLLVAQPDKPNNMMATLFGGMSLKELNTEHHIDSSDIKLAEFEQRRQRYIENADAQCTRQGCSPAFVSTVKAYININYYLNCLKFRISSQKDYAYLKKYELVFEDLKAHRSLLDNVSVTETKMLLYYLLKYSGYKKRKSNGDVFELMSFMDTTFLKKKYMDGFIYDLIDMRAKTVMEQQMLERKMDSYLLKHETVEKPVSKLSLSVLNSQLFRMDGSKNKLSNLIAKNDSNKLVLLDFWASWCAPCIAEIPSLKVWSRFFEKSMQVISISIDDNQEAWLKACRLHGVEQATYRIVGGQNNGIIREFGISSIPRFMLLNSSGAIISAEFYRPSNPRFKISIEQLVNKNKLAF